MNTENTREAGYSWLINRYSLEVIPNWHSSFVEKRSSRYKQIEDGRVEEHFPLRHWPGDTDFDHLEFALKYDGVNLQILHELFRCLDPKELAIDIDLKPYGKYSRKIWYLYELLTGREIPLIDLDKGNYELLLDPDN